MSIGDKVYVASGSKGYHKVSGDKIFSKRQALSFDATRRRKLGSDTDAATAVAEMQDAAWDSRTEGGLAVVRAEASWGTTKLILCYASSWNTTGAAGQTVSQISFNATTLAAGKTGYIVGFATSADAPASPYLWADLMAEPSVSTATAGVQTLTWSTPIVLGNYLNLFAYVDDFSTGGSLTRLFAVTSIAILV